MPTAAEAARRHRDPGEYTVIEGMEPAAAAERPHLTVVCPICRGLIHATEDQAGQRVPCPDCGMSVAVTVPAQLERHRIEPTGSGEPYALWDDVDEASGSHVADQTYVPVTCPVCETFMQVPEDQVGRQITCPDCRVPMVVPPRREPPKVERLAAADVGEYALQEEEGDRPGVAQQAEQTGVPLLCPLCRALIYVGRDQVGREWSCHECGTKFVVPPLPPPVRRPGPTAEGGEVYGIDDAIEVPKYQPTMLATPWRIRPGAQSSDGSRRDVAAAPPRWTFFSGVFTFPVYRSSWSRWVGLAVGSIVPAWLAWQVYVLSAVMSGPSWYAAAVFTGLLAVSGVLWVVPAFSHCLSILYDTAYGHDRVENWPGAVFQDWAGESLFLITSVSLSVLPGMAAKMALESAGIACWPCLPVSVVVLFPVVLMAMLETNSALNLFSGPVWGSLLRRWWVWGLFYIETTALIVPSSLLVLVVVRRKPLVGMIPAAFLFCAVLMIYFRLLGRVAWRCGAGAAEQSRPAAQPPRTDPQDREGEQ